MPSIQDILDKFKSLLGSDALFTSLLILLVGVASFGLGRASLPARDNAVAISLSETAPKQPAVALETDPKGSVSSATSTAATTSEPLLVGSKNGTKYHYLWCPGASQMKEENKVFFKSREEAEASGYTPAANCKGL